MGKGGGGEWFARVLSRDDVGNRLVLDLVALDVGYSQVTKVMDNCIREGGPRRSANGV